MKKVLSLILALVMVLSLGVVAQATNPSNDHTTLLAYDETAISLSLVESDSLFNLNDFDADVLNNISWISEANWALSANDTITITATALVNTSGARSVSLYLADLFGASSANWNGIWTITQGAAVAPADGTGSGTGNGTTPPVCTACAIAAIGHPMNRDPVRNNAGRGDINWKRCLPTFVQFPDTIPAGSIVGGQTEWNEFTNNATAQLQIATVGAPTMFGGQRFGASGTIRSYPIVGNQGGLRIVLEEIRGTTAPIENPIVTAVWRRQGQADILFALLFDCCTWHPAPTVVTATQQLPNTWRVDGISNNGQGRLSRLLSDIQEMTGDASVRIRLVPSDFVWRIPTREFYGQPANASGFTSNVEWANAAELIGSGAFATYDTYAALRNVHFDRVNLRTNRAVNMSGTIYDVDFHWHSADQNMAIRIRTVEFMVRTGTTTVEFDINAQISGGSSRNIGRAIIDVANTRVYVYEGDDSIAPSRTEYLHGGEHVRGIEIYAGVGVYFTRNITARHSIYVQASLVTHDAWDELFQRHAELVDVIKVWETGMLHAASQVRIDRSNTYFVYDSEFRLIGTTADNNLPFSPYYFLTTAQVNLGGTVLPEVPGPEIITPEDPSIPPTGGDGGANNNANMNPGTGR